MPISARQAAVVIPRAGWTARISPPGLAGAALSFATVTYLALSDGGYDTISRSQAGVAVWWLVLLAAFVGLVPRRLGPAGWLALGLMLAFAAWTGASALWSVSAGRSADTLGMVATYAGVFVLALTVQGRGAARHAVLGAAAAVAAVGVLAVLSRLHGAWFPPDPRLAVHASASRLAYPLGYWNGLAEFLAMGVPLLLTVAVGARRLAAGAISAACLPVVLLGIFLADSRGGAIALGVAAAAFLLLATDRLQVLATLAATALATGVLIAYADHHAIVRQGLDTVAARRAGDRMLVVVVLVCAGVGLLQVAIGLVARHAARPRWLEPSRRATAARIGAVVAALAVAAVALGVPGRVDRAWHDFKQPAVTQTVSGNDLFSRLSSASGLGRYQYWQEAVKADDAHPLTGLGAGTFEFWWAAHATGPGHITDAHSLYFQTLAETGIVGLGLIGGLVICLLVAGVWRTLRAPPTVRLALAGATAAVAAFATAAAYEWVWQLGAVSVLALILGAVCVSGRPEPTRVPGAAGDVRVRARRVPRAIAVVIAVAALLAVALPLAAARDLAGSRTAAARGDLRAALTDARAAHRVQPYAAGPELQAALVLELAGDLPAAHAAAVAAIDREATNWQLRLVLARIESEQGLHGRALNAFARAQRLNPLGAVFSK